MSSYDRRTYQRPAGERTADPAWVDEVAAATGKRGRYRTPNSGPGDRPSYGDLSYQYRTLLPQLSQRVRAGFADDDAGRDGGA